MRLRILRVSIVTVPDRLLMIFKCVNSLPILRVQHLAELHDLLGLQPLNAIARHRVLLQLACFV